MLGSFQDAEDALQDTLLAAWQGLGGFEGRASLRTWLYRIATNRCLNARRSASRRAAREWDVPGTEPPEPTRLGEVVWLAPFPDALLEGAIGVPPGPEARYEQTESISLAFVTALQVLPPRQLAVLILRDVLGFHAAEVASLLDTTVESVKSALKRARASLQHQRQQPPAGDREPPPAAGSPAEEAIVAQFISAWESADLAALVALLTGDVFMSMPPMPRSTARTPRSWPQPFGYSRPQHNDSTITWQKTANHDGLPYPSMWPRLIIACCRAARSGSAVAAGGVVGAGVCSPSSARSMNLCQAVGAAPVVRSTSPALAINSSTRSSGVKSARRAPLARARSAMRVKS